MRKSFLPVLLALLAGAVPAARAQSLIVVNQGSATVSVVDPATLAVVAQVAEHQPGKVHVHEAAVSPDGRTAYLPVYGNSGVGRPGIDGRKLLFLDIPSRRVTGSLDFGHGVRPHQALVDPNTGLLYVTNELDDRIAVIDPKTRKLVGAVPTGAPQSHMMVLSHDGRLAYTANVGPGSVSVLDLKARKTLAVIPVTTGVQRIAISSDDRLVFTADDKLPRLAVIDAATRSVRQWIALPGRGYGAAATRDGRWLLIAIPERGEEAVIDLSTLRWSGPFPSGRRRRRP